ncbi:MAG: Uma2 family endonuclease [Cyanothece sp. SIO2G6]|nr:Uma2 family endonuclease [Cyanothece sp. SIO2G6]
MVTFIPRQNRLTVPPLENGDRLSRQEFEHRYAAMPNGPKAELIEGTVYMAAALRFEPHAEPHADLIGWLWTYKIMTPGVRLGDNPTIRMDQDNEPQPDVVLCLDESVDGQSSISSDGYVEGAPELIAEISASTASIDLGTKRQVYRRNGVQEYLVWRVFDQRLDWFCLQGDDYVALESDAQGILRSQVFPGLWLDREALIVGNMQQVMAVLQAGLASPEHQAFVATLTQRRM